MKYKSCGHEIKNKKTIEIKKLGIEVEAQCSLKDIVIKDIKIPKGWRLLTLNEWLICYNKYQNKFIDLDKDSNEIIQQPIKSIKKKIPYWNVWLSSLGNWSGLIGDSWSLSCNDRVRKVRFCRDLKQEKSGSSGE